ncbi:asparagine synthase-related protein [Saccharopolyspora gregorii]|uniref:asparagine synthase-related protein n=1 Tax=Saccharopolyspora gregorii TaxID=33914 RepID=UPI0021ABD8F2|nr:asparagine synthase-related protein [Saccharopolyspora gregorii]
MPIRRRKGADQRFRRRSHAESDRAHRARRPRLPVRPRPRLAELRARRVRGARVDPASSSAISTPSGRARRSAARAARSRHGTSTRQASQPVRSAASAAEGVRLSSPYLDDAVIAACAAVRPHERRSPWRYKPLLVEAMRGLVPDRSLRRSTKAEGSNLEHSGIRRNVAALAALCEDSRLAALG